MKSDHRQRPLFVALLVSCAAHLLLVFGGGFARPMPITAERSAAASVQVRIAESLPNRGAASAVVPQPTSVPRKLDPPAAKVPPPAQSHTTPPRLAANKSMSTVPAQAAPEAREPAAEAASASAAGPASPGEPVIGEPVAADLLRQYRLDLASAARRYRAYPAVARTRGWEGVVELTLKASPGLPPAVSVGRSSGHAVLDAQAEDTLSRAVLAAPMPEALRSKAFALTVPIRFSLEE